MTDIIPQDVKVDPATGRPFPPWMDTVQTARYFRVVYGIPVEAKTLANQRATDRGPRWRYYGQKPLCEQNEADRYAREEALADESPLSRRARERAESLAARKTEQVTPRLTRTPLDIGPSSLNASGQRKPSRRVAQC